MIFTLIHIIEDQRPNIPSAELAKSFEHACRIVEAKFQRDSRTLVSALDKYRKIMARHNQPMPDPPKFTVKSKHHQKHMLEADRKRSVPLWSPQNC
jgi:hypothetical protein